MKHLLLASPLCAIASITSAATCSLIHDAVLDKCDAVDGLKDGLIQNRASGVERTRPLCTCTQVAKYKGSGSIDDAANFTGASE